MKTFVMRAFSNDQNYNADIDYCVVILDEKMAQLIMARRKAFLKIKETDFAINKMFFWGGSQDYFSNDGGSIDGGIQPTLDAALLKEFDEQGWTTAPEKWEPEKDNSVRTECEQMVITESGVFWFCYPKHVEGLDITTEELPFETIEALL